MTLDPNDASYLFNLVLADVRKQTKNRERMVQKWGDEADTSTADTKLTFAHSVLAKLTHFIPKPKGQ